MLQSRVNKTSFTVSLALHAFIAALLFINLEKTIVIPAKVQDEPHKKIIDAVMIDKKALQDEVLRLKAQEEKKRAMELNRQKELLQKEKEAKEKREKEEVLLLELKKKNEALMQKVEKQKQEESIREKERQAKIKKEQDELRRLQREKEQALALKQKAEQEVEQEEVSQVAAQAPRMTQDQIMHYASLMQKKIHQNWRQPIGFDFEGFTCKIAVKLLPTGEVLEAIVVESSGNVEFDRSTELAIRKASPLPMPDDPDIAREFHQFTLTFRPETA